MRSSITVISAAPSHDLTVLDTLKGELGIKLSDKSKDARLRGYIRQASGLISRACGRPFGLETVSERFLLDRTECEDALVLTRRPVVGDITSVTEGTDSVLGADDFDLFDPEHGLLIRSPASSRAISAWSAQTITVVYSGGYQLLDSLPDEIERACLRLATDYYRSAGRDSSVRSVDVPDVESISYAAPAPASQLPDDVRGMLRPYLKVI
jgi:hypothetical protein